MAEAYKYRRENIEDENGNVVDTALFRIPNPRRATGGAFAAGSSATPSGASRLDWSNAEYRGSTPGGRLRTLIRSAAGRGAARNPVMRNNRYGI